MKNTIFAVIIFSFLICGCRTNKPVTDTALTVQQLESEKAAVNFYDPETWILGYFTRARMESVPHSEWFRKGYDEYRFDKAIVNKLTDTGKEGITMKIVLGTWCPDSRREVPRFMRLMDEWNFPQENITFIGTDIAKLSPVGEYDKLNIERVPTFIFFRNNIELGRIIETPVASLEQDMLDILTRNE